MKRSKYFLLCLLALLPTYSLADCNGVLCTDVQLTRLVVRTDGNVTFRTSGDETKLSCSVGNSNYITLRATGTQFKEMYSALLAAHTLQRKIDIRTTEDGVCDVLYILWDN